MNEHETENLNKELPQPETPQVKAPDAPAYVYKRQRFPRLKKAAEFFKGIPGRFKAAGQKAARFFRRVGRFFKELPGNAVTFFKAAGRGIALFFKHPVKTSKSAYRSIKSADKTNIRIFLLGRSGKKGLIPVLVCGVLLILFGFVYLYPMFYMAAYSFMSPSDVINPMVNYVPSALFFGNYREAVQALDYWNSLLSTLIVSVPTAALQTAATALIAYGLSRFNFPGRRLILALVLITFIIPSEITIMPQVLLFAKIGLTDSLLAYYVPAAFGQGLKSAVFVLILYQFFRAMPKEMEEAAKIDGSNTFTIFLRLGMAAAMPGLLLSFLLSLVWYYNETILAAIYFGNEWTTLPLQLERFKAAYEQLFGSVAESGKSVNEAISMAGTMLTVLPLLIIFFFTQRFFTEGIDKAGLTGE